jgi:hypothetical protein
MDTSTDEATSTSAILRRSLPATLVTNGHYLFSEDGTSHYDLNPEERKYGTVFKCDPRIDSIARLERDWMTAMNSAHGLHDDTSTGLPHHPTPGYTAGESTGAQPHVQSARQQLSEPPVDSQYSENQDQPWSQGFQYQESSHQGCRSIGYPATVPGASHANTPSWSQHRGSPQSSETTYFTQAGSDQPALSSRPDKPSSMALTLLEPQIPMTPVYPGGSLPSRNSRGVHDFPSEWVP